MKTPNQLYDQRLATELALRFQPQQLNQDERDWLKDQFKAKLNREDKTMTEFLRDYGLDGKTANSMLSHVINGSGNYREYIAAIADYIQEDS